VKKLALATAILVLLTASSAATQIPEEAAKAAAELAARQAEAAERARQKVFEEMQKAQLERERDRILKAEQTIPVDVEVVISRYQADKKVSNLPYALTVNARYQEVRSQHKTILKMGGQVPVPVMAPPASPDGLLMPAAGPVQYKDIGTQIDCAARPLDDGRFELFISVEDTALAPPAGTTQQAAMPALRTFASSNTIVLRDGQTRQFTAAADRITGEVVRVDVTLRVPK
jgi:hypothetical protein